MVSDLSIFTCVHTCVCVVTHVYTPYSGSLRSCCVQVAASLFIYVCMYAMHTCVFVVTHVYTQYIYIYTYIHTYTGPDIDLRID